jgi:hypothetical protein
MMKLYKSRAAMIAASLAAVALTATPASARHWRHRDRVDTGDVLAGILIIGGIAAVASAASKSSRNREANDYRYPGRLQDGRAFSCTAGSDGRIRSATVDGRALT